MATGGVALAASFEAEHAQTPGSMELTAVIGSQDLYPGSSGGDIHLAVVNTSADPLHFTSVILGELASSDPANCPVSYLVLTEGSLDVVALAHSTTATSIVDVVTMLRSAPDACQGVSFTISLTAQGAAA
jgi:hypothetical protein